jgi:hypothetical protein
MKHDDAVILRRRIYADIGDAFVHRQQHAMFFLSLCHQKRVADSTQTFVLNGMRVVSEAGEILDQFQG